MQHCYDHTVLAKSAGMLALVLVSWPMTFAHCTEHSGVASKETKYWHSYGDFRMRFEDNVSRDTGESWSRMVLRGRLGANYVVENELKLGARIVTGDPNNPRTSDFTVGRFNNDFEVSLDRMFVDYHSGSLFLTGGKFANPFISTELVWDGDVNPQGAAARYRALTNSRLSIDVSAMFFILDENLVEKDSQMQSAQVSAEWRPNDNLKLGASLAYYDYELGPLGSEEPIDSRGNNIAADGISLLSDFDLVDLTGSATYGGFGDHLPVSISGNYVKNRGAAVPEDAGHGIAVSVGNLATARNTRFQYGYMQAETDAVLGLFSHDNIPYATNYKLHSLALDHRLTEHAYVGITYYRFRGLDFDLAPIALPGWSSRTRLNFWVSF